MSQAMRKLAGNLNRTNTVCLFTNQIREKIGVQFGSPETQPGGRALKFYSSQRLDIRRIETLKEGTEAVGNRVRVKVVKNKVASPFRQAEFDIEYGVGISREGGLLDFGIEHDLVQKSGSFFSYGETRLGQGRNNAKQFLADNPEIARRDRGEAVRGPRHRARSGPAPAAARRSPRQAAEAQRARAEGRLGRLRPAMADLTSDAFKVALAGAAPQGADQRRADGLARRSGATAPTEIEAAVGRLTEVGELDDERFARRYAEDKRELRGWGAERVREALLARGVAASLAEAAVGGGLARGRGPPGTRPAHGARRPSARTQIERGRSAT